MNDVILYNVNKRYYVSADARAFWTLNMCVCDVRSQELGGGRGGGGGESDKEVKPEIVLRIYILSAASSWVDVSKNFFSHFYALNNDEQ